ncbi:hypothetical protein [Amycolatopsis cihanbeyliensis]|uniref:Uncharacterized protein n=1 Tax=Amycolatopsis cihanbeyliensis TaxID=1128664 RepID=A0A542DHQ8_AMYCI|nr:hypothetical protein [Amycolatopsis cihanbeyliensis]TQJ02619.1 hypothetical protein FB471_2353 [Amycolatopsis cihanbeyliensis]
MDRAQYETLRGAALEILDSAYCPLRHVEARVYLLACRELEVSVQDLEQVLDLEEAAFTEGEEREVWLCPALEPPDFYSDTDYLTRSDWSPANRIVEFSAEPERRLLLLRHVADEVCVRLEERRDPAAFSDLFMELAGQLPGDDVADRLDLPPGRPVLIDVHDERHVETIREIAEDEHAALASAENHRLRAAGVADLSLRARLFGRVDE